MKRLSFLIVGFLLVIPFWAFSQSSTLWKFVGSLRPVVSTWRVDAPGGLSGSTTATLSHLRNCNTIDTNSNGVLSCGSDTGGGSVNTGAILDAGNSRFVNVSGDTMTGTLTISVTAATSRTLALEATGTISGSHLRADLLTSSGDLVIEGTLSGSSLFGFGLGDCDGATQTLNWDASTGDFLCGTDADTSQSLFETIAVSGQSDIVADAATDTLTVAAGANVTITTTAGSDTLTIAATDTNTTYTAGKSLTLTSTSFSLSDSFSGTALEIAGTASGRHVHAEFGLSASGNLVVEGTMSGSFLRGAGLEDCDAAGDTLNWDTTTGTFSCGSDADTNTTYTAGQGLVLSATSFSLANIHSGTVIQAVTTLASSGTLVFEGAASGSSLYLGTSLQGAGLSDCDDATQTLNWDASTGRFSCGTDLDTNTTYTAGQGLTLAGTVFSLTPSHSGTVIVATTSLRSSGALTWEGAGSGASLYIGDDFEGAGLTDCDGDTQTLSWDSTAKRFGCGDDDDLNTTYTAGQGLTLTSTAFSLTPSHSGTVIWALTSLRSSGTLVWEGAASGATLFGNGLTDCDDGTNSKLLWSDTGKFTCGTDQSSSGLSYAVGEDIFVNQGGDTMTGALIINLSSGTIGLSVIQTASGKIIHAEQELSSSGTLAVEGVTNLDNGTLYVDAPQNEVGIGTIAPETELEVVGTMSGSEIYGAGGLFFVNHVSDGHQVEMLDSATTQRIVLDVATAISNFNLFDATGTVNANLRVDADESNLRMTDEAGNEIVTFDIDTSATIQFSSNDGSNPVFFLNSTTENVGIGTDTPKAKLEVIGTASGRFLHAESGLSSSGTLVFETAGSGSSLYLATHLTAAGSGFVLRSTGTLVINEAGRPIDIRMAGDTDTALLFLDGSTDRVGIGTRTPKTKLEVQGTISGSYVTATETSPKHMAAEIFASGSSLTTGSGKVHFIIPPTMSGFNIIHAQAMVSKAGVTGTTTIKMTNINKGKRNIFTGSGVSLDSTESGSLTALRAYIINSANDDVSGGDVISVDITKLHTTAPKGLYFLVTFSKP